jgi:chaperone modulatory protein CbpM
MSEEPRRGEIVEFSSACTLEELCSSCRVEADWVAALVEQGALEPSGQTRSEWRFTRLSVVRVAKARRLERDLELNPPGLAVVLDLLDDLEELRALLARASARGAGAGEP